MSGGTIRGCSSCRATSYMCFDPSFLCWNQLKSETDFKKFVRDKPEAKYKDLTENGYNSWEYLRHSLDSSKNIGLILRNDLSHSAKNELEQTHKKVQLNYLDVCYECYFQLKLFQTILS